MGLWGTKIQNLAGYLWVLPHHIGQLMLQVLSYCPCWAPLTITLVIHMVAASEGLQTK